MTGCDSKRKQQYYVSEAKVDVALDDVHYTGTEFLYTVIAAVECHNVVITLTMYTNINIIISLLIAPHTYVIKK